MKKLLSLALCAAAASFAAADEITLGNVGVTAITLPAGQTNTIIAASFNDLATGGDISVANLVKTTNLAPGDKIMLYTAKNTYSAWVLGDNGAWQKAEKTYTVGSDGVATVDEGAASDTTTVKIGTGLWIVRKDPTEAAEIALYGSIADAKSTTTAAGAWNLIGNAGQVSFNAFEDAVGDQIVMVADNGALRTYNFKAGDGKGWYYVTYTDNRGTNNYGTPAVAPGQGFWYYTSTAKTLVWSDGN